MQGAIEVWEYSMRQINIFKQSQLDSHKQVQFRHVPFTWFPVVRILLVALSLALDRMRFKEWQGAQPLLGCISKGRRLQSIRGDCGICRHADCFGPDT